MDDRLDARSDRGAGPEGSDAKFRDFDRWERKGPMSVPPPMSSRPGPERGSSFREIATADPEVHHGSRRRVSGEVLEENLPNR